MARSSRLALGVVALSLLVSGAAFAQDQGKPGGALTTLTVTFTGLASDSGALMIALFDSETAYAGGPPARAVRVKASMPQTIASFEGLTPGRYAIKSFHDLDGDGKMGTNPFGMPTEPYAFSNNAIVRMGPPVWSDAAFDVGGAVAAQSITIK